MSTPNDLMRHALGVHDYGDRWSKPYRNRFVAGARDAVAWRALVADGKAAVIREADDTSGISGGFPVFMVTDEGQKHALDGITFKRRWGYGRPVNP